MECWWNVDGMGMVATSGGHLVVVGNALWFVLQSFLLVLKCPEKGWLL